MTTENETARFASNGTTKSDANMMAEFLEFIDPNATEFVFQTCADDKSKIQIREEYVGIAPGVAAPPGTKKRKIKFDPLAKVYVGTLDEHIAALKPKNRAGAGVFVTINATEGGRKITDLRRIRAVWAELDRGLPDKGWPLEPSGIVRTSPGKCHAYWLVVGNMPLEAFRAIQARIVKDYGGDPAAIDPTRVMRFPGTDHMKTGKPYRVTLEVDDQGAPTYTTKQLLKAFPPLEVVRKKQAANIVFTGTSDPEIARSALNTIVDVPSENGERMVDDFKTYIQVGMALKEEFGDAGLSIWLEWAAHSDEKFDETDAEYRWSTFGGSHVANKVRLGTIMLWAQKAGWVHPLATSSLKPIQVDDVDRQSASDFGVAVEVWSESEKAEFLSRMNKEHALVSLASTTRYLHERRGPSDESELVFLRPDDMKRLYANILIPVGERKLNGFEAWDRWKSRRQFRGVGLFPGDKPTPAGYLNLWRGFAVVPTEGDWSLFEDHLFEVICGGNKKLYRWFMDWCAHIIQKPYEKPGSAVVLKSPEKGTGKSMVFEFLRRILGAHAISVSQADHVVGKFNGHLLRNILLGVEEAFWAGNKAAEGVIKNLITEQYLAVEQKGVDPISTRNYTRLLITSNEQWTVPAGIDERRFFVLKVNNPRAKDPSYFDPIFEQMDNGGVEAMLYALQHRTIKSNLRSPPETDALISEREFSLDGVHKWLVQAARDGAVRDRQNGSDIELSDDAVTEVERAIVREAAKEHCSGYEVRALDTRLGRLLADAGVTSAHPSRMGRRRRVYVFPPLAELRASVAKLARVTIHDEE